MATYSTSASLQSQSVGVSGTSERALTASGALQSQSVTLSGVAENEVSAESGALQTGLSTISVTANRSYTISADLNDNDANVLGGSGERIVPMIPEVGNGDFRPTEYHFVDGSGIRTSNALEASLTVNSSVVSGEAENIHTASGVLVTGSSTVDGLAEKKITASGSLVTVDSTVSGISERIVVEIEADLTADEVGVVAISGESERVIVGPGSLSSGVSSVSGTTEITSNGTGTIQSQSSTVSATTSISANGQGSLVSQNSTVSGVSENVIIGTGAVASEASSVSGVAERQIDASGSGNSQSGPSDVVGISERTSNASGAIVVEATLFPATGFSERTITGSGTAPAQSSTVSGEGERLVENNNIVLQALSGPSSVTGVVVRHANGSGVLPSQVSVVSGASEREITGSGSIETVTDSIVTGVVENVISGTGTLTTSSSSVSGIAERTINGSGTLDTISDSTVAGVAENQVDLVSGIAQVDVSSVSGVAERTINASGSLDTVSDSIVSATSERVNSASGSLASGSSVVDATTERTVTRLPDINGYPEDAGDTAFGPDDTDSKVDYVSRPQSYSPRYLELSGTSNVNRDGVYDVLISGFTVAESGINYIPTATTTYNVYYKARGANYDVVVYNTTRSSWYLTTIADIDQFFTSSISNATAAQESLVSTNSIVPYGIEFDPLDAESSVVVGLSERTVVGSGELVQSVDSRVVGIAEREAVAGTGFLQDSYSKVTAVANIGRVTSPALNPNESIVQGLSERIVTVDAGIEQTDASVVAGVSERIVTGQGILVQSTDSVVAGVAERIVTGDGVLVQSTDSVVAGISERQVVTISGIEQVDASVVTGVAERKNVATGILEDSSSVVAGISERVITGSGDLVVPDVFKVNGVAERIHTVTGIDMPDDDSKVTGVAERIIGKPFFTDPIQGVPSRVVGLAERTVENNNITLQVISQESTVAGVAERTINLFSGIEQVQESHVSGLGVVYRYWEGEGELNTITDSIVSGIAERQIDAEGELNTITDSIVAGVSERAIDDQGGDALVTTPSVVTGVAERTINLFSGIEQVQESTVSGIAERTINLFSGIEQVQESTVSGIAERQITGEGELNTITDSLVSGVAEREVETNEITQDLVTTESLVTGVAERIVKLQDVGAALTAGDAVTDNGDPITIDRHPIGGPIYPEYRSDLYAGDAQPFLDADRVITQQPDGLSDTYRYAPNAADPEVTYTGYNNELLKLTGLDPNYDNIYQMLPEGYTIATSGGTDYQLTRDDDHLVYYWRNRSAGYNEYRVVAYRTNNETWAVFETTLNPELFFYDGLIIAGSVASSLTVANSRQSKRGPYKDMRPTEYNVVVGDGDKVHENYETPSDLVTEDCLVTAVVEITTNGLDVTPKASPSVVVGLAERTSEDGGITHNLQAGPSDITCSAERIVVGTGSLAVATSEVSGTTERTIVRIPDGLGPLANSPKEEDANVVYHNDLGMAIRGLTAYESQYNGDYKLLGTLAQTLTGFRAVESGNDYTLVHDENYNVYSSVVSPDYSWQAPYWHVIIFNSDRNAWYAVESTFDPRTFDDGVTITDAVLVQANIADFSELKTGPYKTQQGDDSQISAVVERTSNSLEAILLAQSSTVSSVTEISSNLLSSSDLQADNSTVDADIERKVVSLESSIQSGPSEVFAVDDRTIASVPGKSNAKCSDSRTTSTIKISRFAFGQVPSAPSTVSGIAERASNGTGELESGDHEVNGISERKITAVGVLVATPSPTETVVGESEREVVNVAPTNLEASNSVTDGFAYRIITSLEADLHCTDSKIEAKVYNNVPAQDAMHTQRVFRIRKEPVRTIIVRQTPTRNTY